MGNKKVPQKVDKLKNALDKGRVREQFESALEEHADQFIASLIELYSNDSYLQNCDPMDVIREALKAATLKLPINKQLGHAYIYPFHGDTPTFILGYKGYIQLALRSGRYKHLNAGVVYEGEKVEQDKLTGDYTISGEPKSSKKDKPPEIKGYFAYMELKTGFSKVVYMTKEEVTNHAEQYSPSYGNKGSAWETEFDKMAKKTVLRKLLGKYGILSTELMTAMSSENQYTTEEEAKIEKEREAYENTLDVEEENQESEDDGDGEKKKKQQKLDPEDGNGENRPEDPGF